MSAFQRQVEVRILQHLHTAVHYEWQSLTKDGMFSWICKSTNVSRARFDAAFEALRGFGYFDEIPSGEPSKSSKWKLSAWGVDWVEDYYSFREVNGSLTHWPTHSGMIMIGTRREKYLNDLAAKETDYLIKVRSSGGDAWARSGVLATWIGVVLALAGMLITYMVTT